VLNLSRSRLALALQLWREVELGSSPVLSAEADDDVIEAAHVMREDRVGSLPVVDAGRVIGIVTELDVLRQICRMDSACPRDIAEIVVSYP